MNNIIFSSIKPDELETLIEHSVERAIEAARRSGPDGESDELLTVEGAAHFLDCTKPTIYQKTSRGELPFMKRGKKLYFLKQDIIGYLKAGRNKTTGEIASSPENYLRQGKKGRTVK